MRSVWGLLVAISGLFIVWLWASGRAQATWNAIQSGSSQNTANTNTNAVSPASTNSSATLQPVNVTPNEESQVFTLSGPPSTVGYNSNPNDVPAGELSGYNPISSLQNSVQNSSYVVPNLARGLVSYDPGAMGTGLGPPLYSGEGPAYYG